MANNGPTGIIPRKYKSGSIIFFEGDKSDIIFILKSGKVILTSTRLDTGEEIKEEVRSGEFFGVKSALGRYPREETAQCIGDTIVLIFSLAEFERLILRNVNVVRKMLRVFSNQLRRVGKMVRSVMGEGDNIKPDVELFRIGEHYYKAGDYQKAQYAFKRFMEHYPESENSSVAMERIKAINSGIAGTGDDGYDLSQNSNVADDDSLGDFTFDESSDSVGAEDGLAGEMDDFLSDDSADDGLDDFTFDEPEEEEEKHFINEMFASAMELLGEEEFSHAIELFEEIEKIPPKRDDEKEMVEKSIVYKAKALISMNSLKDAMPILSGFVKDNPDSVAVKEAYYYIGIILEKAKQNQKAIVYFNKALNISPKDEINAQAMEHIKSLQGGR